MELIIRWAVALAIAFISGKIISKLKLPSLLGWLIAGMALGPYALGLINLELVESPWYETILRVFETCLGFMIGSELVYKKLKKSGKALIITTMFQSIGTYLIVSLVFYFILVSINIHGYLGFIFGGIALATAPVPALSIVKEYKTSGPVTRTLIPMAVLDDVVGVVLFFTTIAIIATQVSGGSMPLYFVPIIVFLPMLIGAAMGYPAGLLLKRYKSKLSIYVILTVLIVISSAIGFYFNSLMPNPLLNFVLIGMAFSAVFANMVDEKDLERIMETFNPILSFSLLAVITNLGVPLKFSAIFGAGLFTFIYIVSRAIGKYFGARVGAKLTKMPETVQKYLGFTLLTHSGVSLVFTSISVSTLIATHPDEAAIIQGTIAAAAIINEIIAVILAKKGFEWAGEIGALKN